MTKVMWDSVKILVGLHRLSLQGKTEGTEYEALLEKGEPLWNQLTSDEQLLWRELSGLLSDVEDEVAGIR